MFLTRQPLCLLAPLRIGEFVLVSGVAWLLCHPGHSQEPGAEEESARSRVVSQATLTDNAATVRNAKQVRVISDAPELRAAFIGYTDSLQSEFRQMMHETEKDWLTPLEVHVSGSPNDVVSGATAVIPPGEIKLHADGTFQLPMYVRLHNRYDDEEVRRRFIELMLYEIMVRPFVGKPEEFGERNLRLPFWLVCGFETLLEYRGDGRPSELFAGIVASRQVLPIEEILEQEATSVSDPVTEAVFGASSAALLAALIDGDPNNGGASNLKAYLSDLTSPEAGQGKDGGALLRRHFPKLRGSPGALEKWWSLQVASMGQLQALEYYSVEKTEAMLDTALTIQVAADANQKNGRLRKLLPGRGPKGDFIGRVHDFDEFLDYENAPAALAECREQLRTLAIKAFPLYRDLILRYESVVENLAEEKPRGMKKELETLDIERLGIREVMGRVTDYMNFMEATQAEGHSEAYREFRKMKQKLESEGLPHREDRISRYLDALEREFDEP